MTRFAALFCCLALPAVAQQTAPCDDWRSDLAQINEPVEDWSRSYANSAIRVLIVGQGEPVCCGTWIAVLHPAPEGFRTCTLVLAGDDVGLGWADVAFGGEASYDPARGLTVPMRVFPYDVPRDQAERIDITINQATGRVTLD